MDRELTVALGARTVRPTEAETRERIALQEQIDLAISKKVTPEVDLSEATRLVLESVRNSFGAKSRISMTLYNKSGLELGLVSYDYWGALPKGEAPDFSIAMDTVMGTGACRSRWHFPGQSFGVALAYQIPLDPGNSTRPLLEVFARGYWSKNGWFFGLEGDQFSVGYHASFCMADLASIESLKSAQMCDRSPKMKDYRQGLMRQPLVATTDVRIELQVTYSGESMDSLVEVALVRQ